jgi:hypothetical protein
MDNIFAGILISSFKRAKIPWLSRVRYGYQHSISGVAGFTEMGTCFGLEYSKHKPTTININIAGT